MIGGLMVNMFGGNSAPAVDLNAVNAAHNDEMHEMRQQHIIDMKSMTNASAEQIHEREVHTNTHIYNKHTHTHAHSHHTHQPTCTHQLCVYVCVCVCLIGGICSADVKSRI